MECSLRRSEEGTSSQITVSDQTFNKLFLGCRRKFSVMPMTRGIETHVLNYSRLLLPLVSRVSQLLFWPFILEIDLVVFGGWKVCAGWRGGGVGGELAVTEKPGTACTCPRVQISGKAVQLDAKWKIPLNGWGFWLLLHPGTSE